MFSSDKNKNNATKPKQKQRNWRCLGVRARAQLIVPWRAHARLRSVGLAKRKNWTMLP
jgi:hypothetical protein